MGQTTGISWAHSSWNPIRGCIEVSSACDHCYAREQAKRNPLILGKWGSEENGGTRVVAAPDYWKEPGKWNKAAAAEGVRKRVFCASMADFFEQWDGPMDNHQGFQLWKRNDWSWTTSDHYPDTVALTMDDVRKRTFDLIDETPNLDWLLLTKRPQNIEPMWPYAGVLKVNGVKVPASVGLGHYRPNCWLGTTTENQEMADKRIPELLKCSDLSPVLWLSCEPMLGPINLFDVSEGVLRGPAVIESGGMTVGTADYPSEGYDDSQSGIDWVIVGAESGSKARPTELDWVRSLRDQCQAAGVAFFVKQLTVNGKLRKNIDDFPTDLQIQEVPEPCQNH